MQINLERFPSRDNTLAGQVLRWCEENFGPSGPKRKGYKWTHHHQPSRGQAGKYWIDIHDDIMKTTFTLRWP
jgi:hypothetical protein